MLLKNNLCLYASISNNFCGETLVPSATTQTLKNYTKFLEMYFTNTSFVVIVQYHVSLNFRLADNTYENQHQS